MKDLFSENVNELLKNSLSQIKSSLKKLLNLIEKLEKTIKEHGGFTQNDIFLLERDRSGQMDSISKLKQLMERKRNSLKLIKK